MDGQDNTRPTPAGSPFYEAVFQNTATDPSSVLLVLIPDFSADLPFGDPDGVVWSPIGGALPQAGDRALVAESTDGSWWVIAWWSDVAVAVSEVRGRATATGTGGASADVTVNDGLPATGKRAIGGYDLTGSTFTADACLVYPVAYGSGTTTLRVLPRGGGTIGNGLTVAVNYRIWI